MPSEIPELAPTAKTRRRLAWSFFCAYSAFVFQGSLIPLERIPQFFLHVNDKLMHGIEYFLLYDAGVWAFRQAKAEGLRLRSVWVAIAWCLLMGLATEGTQSFIPGRRASFADLLADLGGTVVAAALDRWASRRRVAAPW